MNAHGKSQEQSKSFAKIRKNNEHHSECEGEVQTEQATHDQNLVHYWAIDQDRSYFKKVERSDQNVYQRNYEKRVHDESQLSCSVLNELSKFGS